MYATDIEIEDTDLKKVGLELMFMTPEKCSSPDGLTNIIFKECPKTIPFICFYVRLTTLISTGFLNIKNGIIKSGD